MTTFERLAVVVPAYNEAASIGATLAALAAQTDRDFALVLADNASADGTAECARRAAATLGLTLTVVTETTPGAGCAFDAGARAAIARGATLLLRTDADCLPRPDWVAAGRRALTARQLGGRGLDMACGRSTPRADERPNAAERHVLPALTRVLGVYGRYRADHRTAPDGSAYLAPYVLCHGHNIGVRASVYLRAGGAARHPLEEAGEDVELLNRVRRITAAVGRAEDMVVGNSLRRLRAYGPRNTVLWYWDRRYRPTAPEQIHVR